MSTQEIQQKGQKLTFHELIERKIQREKNQSESIEIYIESMNGTLVFKRVSEDTVLDIMDEFSNDIRGSLAASRKLIYFSCPLLQSPELHKELEVVDPFDTVKKLFEFKETIDLGTKLLEFNKVAEKAKENQEKTKN